MISKVDWFTVSVFGGEADLTEEGIKVLEEHAENYIRVCGPVSWEAWQLLTNESRKIFQSVMDRIEEARAKRIAVLVYERMMAHLENKELEKMAENAGAK